ncbi:hypothetical protein ABT335_49840, partial [Streptomyces sp. NPDC000618]
MHRCHVFIASDGTITVDGEDIEVAGGSAETAALDHLHQLALTMAGPVEASVLDHQRRLTLVIRVGADGASEFLKPPVLLDELRAASPAARNAAAPPPEVTPPRHGFDDPAATSGAAPPSGRTAPRPDGPQADSDPATTVLRPVTAASAGGATASPPRNVPGPAAEDSPGLAGTPVPGTAAHSPDPAERLPHPGPPVLPAPPIPAAPVPVVPPAAHGTATRHPSRPAPPYAQDPALPVAPPPPPMPPPAPASRPAAAVPDSGGPAGGSAPDRPGAVSARLPPVASQGGAHPAARQAERAAPAAVGVPEELRAGVAAVGDALTARDLVRAEERAA